jgi:hypothetical protein
MVAAGTVLRLLNQPVVKRRKLHVRTRGRERIQSNEGRKRELGRESNGRRKKESVRAGWETLGWGCLEAPVEADPKQGCPDLPERPCSQGCGWNGWNNSGQRPKWALAEAKSLLCCSFERHGSKKDANWGAGARVGL